VLDPFWVAYEIFDRAGCVAVEQALDRVRNRIVGGLRFPNDETGDAPIFTYELAALCAAMGIQFHNGSLWHFNTTLDVSADRVHSVASSSGFHCADVYVAAMKSFTPALLGPIGIPLPIYQVKGYSLTIPVTDASAAPV